MLGKRRFLGKAGIKSCPGKDEKEEIVITRIREGIKMTGKG